MPKAYCESVPSGGVRKSRLCCRDPRALSSSCCAASVGDCGFLMSDLLKGTHEVVPLLPLISLDVCGAYTTGEHYPLTEVSPSTRAPTRFRTHNMAPCSHGRHTEVGLVVLRCGRVEDMREA